MQAPIRTPKLAAGKRERRKAVTRQELLLAGRRLFSEKGLYEARIEDLARHAGIAKGTLYLYFRSKEELIQAVAAAGFDELHHELLKRCRGAASLHEMAGRIAAVHLSFYARQPDMMRVLHQLRGMLKFNRARWRPLRALLAAHLARLSVLLEKLPPDETPPPEARDRIALLVFGAVSGAASVQAAACPEASLMSLRQDVCRAVAALAVAMVIADNGQQTQGEERTR